MADLFSSVEQLNIGTSQIQSITTFIFYVSIGLVVLVFIGYMLWKMVQGMQYKLHVTVHNPIGNAIIKNNDWARKYTDGFGKIYLHYKGLNKKSPMFKDDYLKIMKVPSFFGLMTKSVRSLDCYIKDGKIIPMAYNEAYTHNERGELRVNKVSLTGFDYDAFNFMQEQIISNKLKYEKTDRLMQLLPYAALFVVVMGFIMGLIFYGQHVEKVAMNILEYTKYASDNILESSGALQIID